MVLSALWARALGAALMLCIASCSPAQPERHLRIAAAASLGDTLPSLLEQWSAQNGVTFEVTFAGSGELATQTRHGAPFDLVFLASCQPLIELHELGRLRGDIMPGPKNNLVWLEHSGEPQLKRIALGGPGVPAGDAARAWLASESDRFPDWQLIEFPHVRSVLAAVESGACSHGFVYATDAREAVDASVLFSDTRAAGRVIYGMGIPKQAQHATLGKELAVWLQGQSEQWAQAGFLDE